MFFIFINIDVDNVFFIKINNCYIVVFSVNLLKIFI